MKIEFTSQRREILLFLTTWCGHRDVMCKSAIMNKSKLVKSLKRFIVPTLVKM